MPRRPFITPCVLLPALAATTGLAQPINTCGRLVAGVPCILFEADAGGRYVLDPAASAFQPGDRIRVIGDLDLGCTSVCIRGNGCIRNAASALCTPSTCRADFDGSGALGVQDIFAFLEAYFSGAPGTSPPGGDFDQNGSITVNDIFVFLAAYFTGCS